MLAAMRLWPMLVAITTCVALAACGGSSHGSSTQAAGTPAASTTSGSSTPGAVASTDTSSVSGEGPAVTTTTSASAPPEVPHAKTRHHGSTRAASQGVHVDTNLAVGGNGDISPPVVSVPSGVGVELRITNHGISAVTVAVSVPSHPSAKVGPGAKATLRTGGLKNGTYRILVNGTPRGQLMIGAQGGP
jgi:hypothetical protein